ncbi:MAG TPA: GNAT family N-acetyltransferase [Anaerolineae bacterium]|nr:GNAT family N-acetyltransferase [Anaerolineae bacterium]
MADGFHARPHRPPAVAHRPDIDIGGKPSWEALLTMVRIRPASEADIQPICDLVNHFADQNLMLHRTPEQVRRALGDFLVAEADGRVIGCGYLAYLGPDLVELRSLAVDSAWQGKGVGGEIVDALVALARQRGLRQICALTLAPHFFERQGFRVVDRWEISPKIWSECVYCPKFHACDEIAVLRDLSEDANDVEKPEVSDQKSEV